MSKNIVIQENGVAQTLNTISRVVTSGQRSGDVDWVPEDERQLGEITIKKNSDVTAQEKGLYAFSKVTVKASGKAVGKKKNGDYVVYDVDENGILVEHPLPSRLAVVTPPTKTNYQPDEDINITGMVVKAYYSDNSEYGTVHNSRLRISPTKATDTVITVSWNRDGDGAVLTATFNITIGD